MGAEPLRRCVSCRQLGSKLELIRLVRTPEGDVLLDLSGKAQGRGAYVHRQGRCVEDALKRRQLDRALRCHVPAELAKNIAALGQEHEGGGRSGGSSAG
ncbi:YlxR family protein [bacterium]|nr:YlxR family protein [bacterium]